MHLRAPHRAYWSLPPRKARDLQLATSAGIHRIVDETLSRAWRHECVIIASGLCEDLKRILSNISSLQEKHVRRRQRRARPHASVVDFKPFFMPLENAQCSLRSSRLCLHATVPIHYASPQVTQRVSAAACGPAKKVHQINRGSQPKK